MEEALAAIRQAITNDEAGEPTSAPPSQGLPRTSGAKPIPRLIAVAPGTVAVGSVFNILTETVRKHEPTLEDVVGETLRHAELMAGRNCPRGLADGAGRSRTDYARTLVTILGELLDRPRVQFSSPAPICHSLQKRTRNARFIVFSVSGIPSFQ